ncbi:MAG: sulfatase [Pirellulales bacterium]|nr:sulfatase [Pirellulales bacterium]
MNTFQACYVLLRMHRLFAFVATAIAILSINALFSTSCLADGAKPKADRSQDRPNLVFILADDMGWPDLRCYGNKFNESPHLDRLCRQGMKFTDFYAATPVCSSTRSTIQTGQYSTRTGITNFVPGHFRPFEKLLEPRIDHNLGAHEIQTPGELFSAAGYATGYFGKWHLEFGNDLKMHPKLGFATLYRDKAQLPEGRGYQVTDRTIPKSFFKQRGKKPIGPKKIDLFTDMAIWFMEQNKDRPFFLTLAHHAVHIPVETTSKSYKKYLNKPKPKNEPGTPDVHNPYYAGMIEDMDRHIGRVLDKLDELGLADNTIVVYTSDNGGLRIIYTAQFNGDGEIISSNAPLRDEKGSLYEGGIRVPMIVRWPGVVQPGSVCNEPTTTADLLPTFCQMCDVPLPKQVIDGQSLVPLLKAPKSKLARDAIYFHYPHYHHSRPAGAIRERDMKLIEFFDDGSLEIYDLGQDIGESNNLAKKMPERAAAMQKKLAAWRTETGARMPTVNPKFDPARRNEWWNLISKKPLPTKKTGGIYLKSSVKDD